MESNRERGGKKEKEKSVEGGREAQRSPSCGFTLPRAWNCLIYASLKAGIENSSWALSHVSHHRLSPSIHELQEAASEAVSWHSSVGCDSHKHWLSPLLYHVCLQAVLFFTCLEKERDKRVEYVERIKEWNWKSQLSVTHKLQTWEHHELIHTDGFPLQAHSKLDTI